MRGGLYRLITAREATKAEKQKYAEHVKRMKWLKPGMKPEATFKVADKPIAAFEYCNLHGLWKAEV